MSSKLKHRILAATTNPGKLAEIKNILADMAGNISLVSLADFPGVDGVKEDGATFAENARKKAVGYSKATGLPTLAEDSGLVIDAMNGLPGVRSARFAAEENPDIDKKELDKKNIKKTLELLKNTPPEKRSARFVCCACLVNGSKILAETEGILEGYIAAEPRGRYGFGYDPIFEIKDIGKTAAQLDPEEKNRISHRAIAMQKIKTKLLENNI